MGRTQNGRSRVRAPIVATLLASYFGLGCSDEGKQVGTVAPTAGAAAVSGTAPTTGGAVAAGATAGSGGSSAGPAGTRAAGSSASPTGGRSGGAAAVGGNTPAANGGSQAPSGGTSGTPAPAGSGAPPAAGANVWTHMGYDHRNWYFNPNETTITVDNAPMLVEKWRFTVQGFPPGTPLIVDGKVYVMATGGTYAIDLKTGMLVWERRDLAGTASLAYADGFIYAHSTAGPNLFKLKASDGTTVWGPVVTYDFAGCDGMSSPVVIAGKVFVGHSCGGVEVGPGGGNGEVRGGVESFSSETGERIWTYWTADADVEDGAMVWSTVGVDVENKTVYATSGNNYTKGGPNSDAFHAIDLDTGMRKWVHQVRSGDVWALLVAIPGPDGDIPVNPIVMDDMIAAGDKVSAFWGVSKAGQRLWGREMLTGSRTANNGGILNAGAFDGERLYTIANDPTAGTCSLFAFDPKTGQNAWEPKLYQDLVWGGVSSANGVLFAAINDELVVLEAKTGKELKIFNVNGSIAGGSAAVAEGMIVVGSGLQYPFGGAHAINNNQVIAFGLP